MRVLILKMGTTEPSVVASHGDYDDWFREVLEDLGCEVSVAAVFEGKELADHFVGDAILLTGSPLSVRDQEPWMQRVGEWSLQQAEKGYPVLGVCFGHQLLGECLGARVVENPKGPEWGTIEVHSAPDWLFEGLPKRLIVQASHRDVLADTPDELRVLAWNDNTEVQAFSWGERVRAVQFHPEAQAHVIRDLLDVRNLEGPTQASEHGRKILSNWIRQVRKTAP